MKKVHEELFDLHHLLPQSIFQGQRPTVTFLPIFENSFALVRPKKVPENTIWWVPPQGGIKPGDGTIMGAMMREVSEELGLEERDVIMTKVKPLYMFQNPIPVDRKGVHTVKMHYVVSLPIRDPNRIFLNRNQNTGFTWVGSRRVLNTSMKTVAAQRPIKYHGTHAALRVAQDRYRLIYLMH